MSVDWVQILQTFGLAVTILFFIAVASWKAAGWFGREIIIPARDRIVVRVVEFLANIEKTVSKLDANVDVVTNNLTQQTTSLQNLQATSAKVHEGTERVAKALDDEHASLKSILTSAITESKARQTEILAEIKEVHAIATAIMSKVEVLVAKE